ncbi:MAG: peptide chain release factor N(5)-glutamine methyltransferase [Verrucomicrobiales bacterium]
MATILDTLKKGTEYLLKHEVDDARLNMEHLIAHVLKIDRMQLYLNFDRPLEEDALESLRHLTKRRSRGEPLQHLLGTVEFCGREFKTDGRALVPRPETEELTAVLASMKWPENVSILDMGCGSGVIGLSLAKALDEQEPTVVLADLSPEALSLARDNAAGLGIDDRVAFVESDLFSAVDDRFDLVVANLPYIPRTEDTSLSREVQRDPPVALYGGETGTEIIEEFLRQAESHLVAGGMTALEFGIGQAGKLRLLAEDLGFENVGIRSDLSGVERFLFASKAGENC